MSRSDRKCIVVLSGAGVSAESGIATFRDGDGLWERHRIEDVATPAAWEKDPEMVNRFYNYRRQQIRAAQPNEAHRALAELEKDFDVYIITQNIDDLHERAGSSRVLHLHGEIFKMRCEKYKNDVRDIQGDITAGHRSYTGARMRPHIVWFGEEVPHMHGAASIARQADIFIVIGTSLNVYPAAGLLHSIRDGVPVIIIDKKIPAHSGINAVTAIEKKATEGVKDLRLLLGKHIQDK